MHPIPEIFCINILGLNKSLMQSHHFQYLLFFGHDYFSITKEIIPDSTKINFHFYYIIE